MQIIQGNILDTDKNIIVQQVNCKGAMGKGLAYQIMKKYPYVKTKYVAFHAKQLSFGGRTEEDLLGLVHYVKTLDGKFIANVFGQLDYRKDLSDNTVYTKKEALLKGILQVKKDAEKANLSVALPTFIGCGLAGGDWNEIKPEIEAIFADNTVDAVFYHYR